MSSRAPNISGGPQPPPYRSPPPLAARRHDHVEKIVRVQKTAVRKRLNKPLDNFQQNLEAGLTHERLLELLNYDQETGVITRLVATSNRVKAGDVAGWIDGDGYRVIRVDGKSYKAHRLAWFWMTGGWPARQIDHWSLDKGDNRWTNLREATNAQNQRNTRPPATNTSGFKGVTWHRSNKKWEAKIKALGKSIYLGSRDSREECAALYAEAAEKYFGEFARVA